MTPETIRFRTSVPAFTVDGAQRIVHMNEGACGLLGIDDARSVIGRHCYQVVRGRRLEGGPLCEARCRVSEAVNAGAVPESFSMMLPVARTGGNGTANGSTHLERVPVEVSCVLVEPSSDQNGGPQVLHLMRDARDQQAALRLAGSVVEEAGRFLANMTADSKLRTLTNREQHVLTLIARGLETAAIAESLGVSKATVRNHTQHILKKLGCHSRLEAVAAARPLLLAGSFDDVSV